MLYFKFYTKNLLRLGSILGVFLMVAVPLEAQVFPMDTIMKNGNRTNRINLVFISDGYQSSELNTFKTNATDFNNAIFAQTPFKEYKNFFNAFTIKVPSNQSGAKHPGNATDENTSGGQPVANPDNYFQSTFDYALIHRLLVPQNNAAIYSALASNLPDYDQCFVIVNSPYYGGSGGAFATSSIEANSKEVAIHELGHSFGNLADEYWAGTGYAREAYNMTQDNNPATNKWKGWIGINGVGIYPYGTVAPQNAWYRPHQLCKMQYLGYPFCAVCAQRIVDRIHELVSMIDNYTPTASSFSLTNSNNVDFSITNILSDPSTMTTKWYLNGSATPFATNVNNVSIPYSDFVSGANTVKAEVTDNTTLSKTYLPAAGYINSMTWNVDKGALPVMLSSFGGIVNALNQGELNWQVQNPTEVKSFDIEKSKDGITFSKLAAVEGTPNSTDYTFTDRSLLIPYTYYRLAMYDRDGAVTYSSVIRLTNPIEKSYYKVYQDPDSRLYHLNCVLDGNADISFTIFSSTGSLIRKKSFGKISAQLDYDFSLAGQAAGIYFMNVVIDGRSHNVQLLAK